MKRMLNCVKWWAWVGNRRGVGEAYKRTKRMRCGLRLYRSPGAGVSVEDEGGIDILVVDYLVGKEAK